jgi:protein O-GlcNAc transferase
VLRLCTLLLLSSAAGAFAQGDARRSTPGQGVPSNVEGREALQRAATLVQQGRLDEAERVARSALTDPQAQAVAYSVLGTIKFQQNRLADSASFLEKAIALEPKLVGAHLSLAEVYTLQGKPELALPMFRRVLKLDPANKAAKVALARSETDNRQSSIAFGVLLATEGRATEAIDILERAGRTGAPSFELAFNLAGAYLLNNDPTRALEAYDRALALKPDSLPALRQAATIAERQGELERSLSYWIRAKKVQPDDPEILLGFGRVCLRMDLLEDAEPALLKAAELKPREPAYQYTLAAAKVGKRQFEAAQRLIEALVDERPADPQLQYALGSILHIQGHLPEAGARLRESIRLQPDQLASNYYLALVTRDQGNEAEAIQMLERLLQRYPDHAASSEALGGMLMSAQRYTEAETNLRNAVRLNPKSVKANYQLGLLLARMGKKEEADKQLEYAKSLRAEDEANSRLQLRLLDPGQ